MDPDPDPTPFFSDFKDGKKNFISVFFSYNLTTATLSSDLKNFVLPALFQFSQHIYKKREGIRSRIRTSD